MQVSTRTNNYAPFDFPDYRVNHLLYSIQATGLDFAGPLFIQDIHIKDCLKVYILLLTCASSCAINLEFVPDLKFESRCVSERIQTLYRKM